MKKLLSIYCFGYLILLTVVLVLLCMYPKLELHLMLNAVHTHFLDTFFKYYTMMAEGPLYVLALLPILWKQIRMTLFFALSELTGGGVLQLMKHLISTDRPVSLFEHYQGAVLPLVPGVDMHYSNSFPSGHASTFFVFYTCCALVLAYHYRQQGKGQTSKCLVCSLPLLSLLMLAVLGAYSRVYLSQHFLSDACVGSIIGFVTPFLLFFFAGNRILKLKKNDTASSAGLMECSIQMSNHSPLDELYHKGNANHDEDDDEHSEIRQSHEDCGLPPRETRQLLQRDDGQQEADIAHVEEVADGEERGDKLAGIDHV